MNRFWRPVGCTAGFNEDAEFKCMVMAQPLKIEYADHMVLINTDTG